MGRRAKKSTPLNPLYGYPAELIAKWCCVSVGTAEHWKAGRRPIPAGSKKLFRLHAERKVLGEEWARFKIVGDKLFSPNGCNFRPNDIELMELVWQALAELDNEKYHYLIELGARRTGS